MVSGDKSVICKQEIVKGTAILNAINNKYCLSFQTKSWIIFHLQGKDFTDLLLDCEVEHASP
jgi:hypothetical protein